MNKRGQFFILAAVIISTLIFSLGLTANKVFTKKELVDIEHLSNIIDAETNKVLDYQVYSNVGSQNISDFVEALAADLRDADPNANFLFVFGNSTNLTIKNLGAQEIILGDNLENLKGRSQIIESKIKLSVGTLSSDIGFNNARTEMNFEPEDTTIQINFGEHEYEFPITDYNQVIFIIQKNQEEEIYVEVK